MDFNESEEAGEGEDEAPNLLSMLPIEENKNSTEPNKDSLFFVIDCSKEMLSNIVNKKESLLETCLISYSNYCKNKIISNVHDRVGLILYNTKDTNNQLKLPHINVFHKLDELDAEKIKNASKLSANSSALIGDTKVEMTELLAVVSMEFKIVEKINTYKRIFLFTCCDDPTTPINKKVCIQKFDDILNSGFIIELFPLISQDNQKFDVMKFYNEAISFDESEVANLSLSSFVLSRIEDLNIKMRQKECRKRIQASLLLHITPNMTISVSSFNLVIKSKIPAPSYMDAKTNKPAKTLSRFLCVDTGTILHNHQIGYFLPLGGKKVIFTKEEIKKIDTIGTTGMKIMGFKPAERIKPYHNIKPSLFISADDSNISGSSQVMHSLIVSMIELKQVAIAQIVTREGSSLKYAALLPQQASTDKDGFRNPPGFHIIILPFNCDFRKVENYIPLVPKDDITDDDVKAASGMVNDLKLDFSSRNFQNYQLQNFYSILQALALQEKDFERAKNNLVADVEGFKRCAESINKFKELIPNHEEPKQRKNSFSNEAPMKKKAARKKRRKNDDDDD